MDTGSVRAWKCHAKAMMGDNDLLMFFLLGRYLYLLTSARWRKERLPPSLDYPPIVAIGISCQIQYELEMLFIFMKLSSSFDRTIRYILFISIFLTPTFLSSTCWSKVRWNRTIEAESNVSTSRVTAKAWTECIDIDMYRDDDLNEWKCSLYKMMCESGS